MAEGENIVKLALERLTLADVWELVPDRSEVPLRDGVISSPFRDDRKKSFSLSGGLKFYKDFADGDKRRGVWNFVLKCHPEWSKLEVARYLVERAGLEWPERKDDGKAPISAYMKQKLNLAKAAEAAEEKLRAFNKALYVERGKVLPPWPDFVRDHFYGRDERCEERVEALAVSRGWPVEWVEGLFDGGWLRFVPAPWGGEERFVAFSVSVWSERGLEEPVGYHQRLERSWAFVPWRVDRGGGGIMSQLRGYVREIPGEDPLLTPLPFVLGNPLQAEVWIVTEGQWDAATIWGLIGGFEDCFELPVAVFGLRGAGMGPFVFLQYYGALLRRRKPRVWLFPDNDVASADWEHRHRGAALREKAERMGRRADVYAGPGEPTFTDRLRVCLGETAEIPVTRIRKQWGKDFNDYYKARKPSRASFLAEMERLGIYGK